MAAPNLTPLAKSQDRFVEISLNKNGYPVVDDPRVHVKRNRDQVIWKNTTKETMTIRFNPFSRDAIPIGANQRVPSGPSDAPNATYKYSITVDSSGNTTDPEVVVEN